jgi:hypothetical protein
MLQIPFKPTADQELNAILEELVSGMQASLKENFLGAYLSGSFAHGGWDAWSDVDFDAVIERDLSHTEREELKVVHARIFTRDCYYARHLEGAYFPRDILRDLKNTDAPLWYLDNGSLNFEQSTHDNTLVVRWVLRECGVTLAGPAPSTWIPPVPDVLLKAEVRKTMRDWGGEILRGEFRIDDRFYQAFTVLSMCRMLHTLAVGGVHSKAEGAAWAKGALAPDWVDLIDDALIARPNQYEKCWVPADPEKLDHTIAFIRHALDAAGADRE